MMSEATLTDAILEAYLSGSQKSLQDLARENGTSLSQCEQEWQELSWIGKAFRQMSDLEPSQISINKIIAHAREQAQHDAAFARKFSFMSLFRPTYALASILTVFTLGWMTFHNLHATMDQNSVAKIDTKNTTATVAPKSAPTLSEYALTTPLDLSERIPQMPSSTPHYGLIGPATLASPVSLGGGDTTFKIDEEIDQKMISDSVMNDKELEALYFRARKFEHLGYYRDALKDYQFLSKFYPNFEQHKNIQLAMANCLEQLKLDDKAILVLEKFEATYGESEDIELWIDELKSETF